MFEVGSSRSHYGWGALNLVLMLDLETRIDPVCSNLQRIGYSEEADPRNVTHFLRITPSSTRGCCCAAREKGDARQFCLNNRRRTRTYKIYCQQRFSGQVDTVPQSNAKRPDQSVLRLNNNRLMTQCIQMTIAICARITHREAVVCRVYVRFVFM